MFKAELTRIARDKKAPWRNKAAKRRCKLAALVEVLQPDGTWRYELAYYRGPHPNGEHVTGVEGLRLAMARVRKRDAGRQRD